MSLIWQLGIQTNDLASMEIEDQLADNSMDLRLKQKISSNEVQQVRNQFESEKEYIQNEIDSLDDDGDNDEYEDLMTELKELKDEEDRAVSKIEEAATDYETRIQEENQGLETRLKAIETQTETYEEGVNKSIEEEFGYFQ